MRIQDMHWQQVQELLKTEKRAILPLGCTEQHAYLSLSTDSILAEKLALDVTAQSQVPVFPVLGYGLTPSFVEFPGTVTLRSETYLRVVADLVRGILQQGFDRLLILNGHGGNAPARAVIPEVMADFPDARVIWHDWWIGPKTWKVVQEIDPDASHASWMENFPWTRLDGIPMPETKKPMFDPLVYRQLSPKAQKEYLGDGNFGGYYQRSAEEMSRIWNAAIREVKELLDSGWAQ